MKPEKVIWKPSVTKVELKAGLIFLVGCWNWSQLFLVTTCITTVGWQDLLCLLAELANAQENASRPTTSLMRFPWWFIDVFSHSILFIKYILCVYNVLSAKQFMICLQVFSANLLFKNMYIGSAQTQGSKTSQVNSGETTSQNLYK